MRKKKNRLKENQEKLLKEKEIIVKCEVNLKEKRQEEESKRNTRDTLFLKSNRKT